MSIFPFLMEDGKYIIRSMTQSQLTSSKKELYSEAINRPRRAGETVAGNRHRPDSDIAAAADPRRVQRRPGGSSRQSCAGRGRGIVDLPRTPFARARGRRPAQVAGRAR